MDFMFFSVHSAIGSIAFAAGIVFVIVELVRKGLSFFSLLAYACFVAGIVLISQDLIYLVVSVSVVTALFLLLWLLYRRELKRNNQNIGEDE